MPPTASSGTKLQKRGSIQVRLILAFLALSLIPVLIISSISFFQSQKSSKDQQISMMEALGTVQTIAVNDWLNGRLADIGVFANTARVQSMDPVKARDAIKSFYDQWKIYETMFVADRTGQTIAINTDVKIYLKDRQYFQDAMAGKTTISQPVVSKATQNIIIVIAGPVYNDDKIVGVVGLTVPMSYLSGLMKGAQLGSTGDAYLVNLDGMMLTPSRFEADLKAGGWIKEQSVLEMKVDTEAVKQIKAGGSAASEYNDYDGKKVLGMYDVIPRMNWGLIIQQDSSEAFANVTQLLYISIIVFLITALLVGFISFRLASSLSLPIKKMAGIASQLALGNIEQVVQVKTDDEVGMLAGSFINMIKYQKEMAAGASQMADGDFSITVQPQSDADQLGHSFVKMVSNLKETIRQVADNSTSLNDASKQLADASNQAGSATNEIVSTIQQVASGTTHQSEAASKTAGAIEQLSRAIDGVARGAQEQAAAVTRMADVSSKLSSVIDDVAVNAANAKEKSREAAHTAEQGVGIVAETVQGMSRIKAKVSLSSSKVEEMGSRSEQIGEIVATIEDIASQTNLLALNAAIEAARAGEHGKGFAVVADEVRKLAERAGASTKEVSGLIRNIQQTVADAVTAMSESAKEVEEDVRLASNAGDVLTKILESAQKVTDEAEKVTKASSEMQTLSSELISAADEVSAIVEENTAATEEMAAGSAEITQSIESIASVSEQNSASVEEVSASTEEMSAQVEEVAASAHSLSSMAANLQNIVSRFKI